MTNVNCICRKIKTPNINVVYETKTSKGLPCTAWHQRQEGAHLADIPATTRFGQLYTRQNLVPIILCVFVQPYIEIEHQDIFLHHHATNALQCILRKSLPGHRIRYVLISEPGKAVV